jgi:hypothetical protein
MPPMESDIPQAACEQALVVIDSELVGATEEMRELVHADVRLQFEYPGEHVAYRDHLEQGPDGKAHLRREVLVHSPDAAIFLEGQRRLMTTPQDVPSSDIRTRFMISPWTESR